MCVFAFTALALALFFGAIGAMIAVGMVALLTFAIWLGLKEALKWLNSRPPAAPHRPWNPMLLEVLRGPDEFEQTLQLLILEREHLMSEFLLGSTEEEEELEEE